MRFARSLALSTLVLGLTSLGCDRIQGLKDGFFPPAEDPAGESTEIAAIRELYEAGRFDEALQKIAEAIELDPGAAEVFYYRGLCHLARAGSEADPKAPLSEEETRSLESFQRALSLNPRHAPSSIGVGDLYGRRVPGARRPRVPEGAEDPYALALAAYERAVTIDPKLPEAQRKYALFLERTGQLDLADAAYRAAAEAAAPVPEIAPDYYVAYGRFLAGPRDRLPEAIDQFELARLFRQEDPQIRQEIAVVHSRIGLRHLDKQEYLMAEEALKKAEALFPDRSIPEARKTEEALQQLRSIRRR